MTDLTTLQAVKRQVSIDSVNTTDDLFLKICINIASRMVEGFTQRRFVPVWGTRTYDAVGDHIEDRELFLDHDLLELTTLVNGDGSSYDLADLSIYPPNASPKYSIRLRSSANGFVYANGDPLEALQVTGVWGFHSAYASAWVDTLDAVKDVSGIDAIVTIITVDDADGEDARGLLRFGELGYYRIDDEVIQVTDIDTSTETLTVRRGMRGTTAAPHALDAGIDAWAVEYDVEQACIALVLWLYRNRDTMGEKIQFMNGTTIEKNIAPSYIRGILSRYERILVT